jgi:hypothetical protein
VTDLLVDRLEGREEYDIIDARRYEIFTTPPELSDALRVVRRLAKDARPDGVLISTVRRDPGRKGVGATVDLESRMIHLDPKADFPEEKVRATEKIESRASIDWFAPYMEQVSRLLRLGLWVVATAGLPFALFPVVQAVTRRENTRLNAALVGGLCLVNVVAALVLMGFRPGIFGWLLVLLAGLAGFVYNFVICDRIDEMRK